MTRKLFLKKSLEKDSLNSNLCVNQNDFICPKELTKVEVYLEEKKLDMVLCLLFFQYILQYVGIDVQVK